MALAGKATKFQVSVVAGGAGTYYDVDDMNSCNMSMDGNNLDVTKFTAAFIKRIQGLKDCGYQASGFRAPADTNGQNAIISAWLNDSELWVKILPDGTSGWKQQVRVSNVNISSDVEATVDCSFDFEGTDAIAAV